VQKGEGSYTFSLRVGGMGVLGNPFRRYELKFCGSDMELPASGARD
jgi:hypothetical protein